LNGLEQKWNASGSCTTPIRLDHLYKQGFTMSCNGGQMDSDGDGFGNACDSDFNDADGVTTPESDLNLLNICTEHSTKAGWIHYSCIKLGVDLNGDNKFDLLDNLYYLKQANISKELYGTRGSQCFLIGPSGIDGAVQAGVETCP